MRAQQGSQPVARYPRLSRGWHIVAVIVVLAGVGAAAGQGLVADTQRAISVAAAHPFFAAALSHEPGWTATAYEGENSYGLWRVDFFRENGEALGWAQLRLTDGRVFGLESNFGLEGTAYAEAEAALVEFLRTDPEFVAFAGDVDDNDWLSVYYQDWSGNWVVYLERGRDSLEVTLRSEGSSLRSLEGLRLVQISAPAMPSVADWTDMRGSEAAALAFTDPAVATAVRGLYGWTSVAEQLERSRWRVRFEWEEQVVAVAEVDLLTGSVETSSPSQAEANRPR